MVILDSATDLDDSDKLVSLLLRTEQEEDDTSPALQDVFQALRAWLAGPELTPVLKGQPDNLFNHWALSPVRQNRVLYASQGAE